MTVKPAAPSKNAKPEKPEETIRPEAMRADIPQAARVAVMLRIAIARGESRMDDLTRILKNRRDDIDDEMRKDGTKMPTVAQCVDLALADHEKRRLKGRIATLQEQLETMLTPHNMNQGKLFESEPIIRCPVTNKRITDEMTTSYESEQAEQEDKSVGTEK